MTGRRRPLVALLVLPVVLPAALTGCGGHATSGAQPEPSRPTSASVTATAGRLPVSPAATLRCEEPIDGLRHPRSDMRAAGDAVALVVHNPQSFAMSPTEAPHRRWEKSPLSIRLGRAATVEVPSAWTSRLAFTWGTNAPLTPWTTKLVVPRCHQGFGHRPWVSFPGGYSFDHPACVPIRVTVAGRSSVVHVALGHGVTCAARS